MLRTDSHLASVYETRLTGVAGAPWMLTAGAGDPAMALLALDRSRAMLDEIPDLERAFYDSLHAIGVGYSVLEIIWGVRDGWVVPTELVWIDPDRFRFDDHYKIFLYDFGRAASYATDENRVSHAGAYGMSLAEDKYIVHVPRILPGPAPMSGLLQTVARQWWVRQWVTRYWLAGAEVAGNPRWVGKYPTGAADEVKRNLRIALESLAADGILTMGDDVSVEILAPEAQGNASIWNELLKAMAADESKAILGSGLNVEVGDRGGNRALGESQFDTTTLPRAEKDARAMWSTWRRCLIRTFLKFNVGHFGGVMPPVPRGHFELFKTSGEVDDLLIDCGGATVDDLRRARGLQPLGPENGGNAIAVRKQPEQQSGFGGGAPPAPGVALSAEPAAPTAPALTEIDVTVGSEWIDTADGHRIEVTNRDPKQVYFRDLDSETPERQWTWATRSFLERCRPKPGAKPSKPKRGKL